VDTSAAIAVVWYGEGVVPSPLTEFFSKIGFTVVHFHAFLRIFKCLKLKLTKSTRAMHLTSRRETARCHCNFLSIRHVSRQQQTNKKPSCHCDSRPYCITADYLVISACC